jgi:eukaryotic-like serine/threonine-protein kinase
MNVAMNDGARDEVDVIDQVTDAFVAHFRTGQRPDINEYLKQHPTLAEQLAEMLPAIALLEQHAAIFNSRNLEARSQATTLPSQHEIGDYTIVREVGRGGMGVVYEGMQQSLGRHVALKVLSVPAQLNVKHLERFRFEARAAAGLQHTNIVPVFGVGELNDVHYYAMQFIHGKSLHEVVAALRQMSGLIPAKNGDTSTGSLTNNLATSLLPNDARSSAGQRAADQIRFADSQDKRILSECGAYWPAGGRGPRLCTLGGHSASRH